jgi:hypothetical protein
MNNYLSTQEDLLLRSTELFFNSPVGFKSLNHYKNHNRLLNRWCFLHGCRSMEKENGKNFNKNRFRKMKKQFRRIKHEN